MIQFEINDKIYKAKKLDKLSITDYNKVIGIINNSLSEIDSIKEVLHILTKAPLKDLDNVAKEFLRDKKKFNTMAELPEEGVMCPEEREDNYELEKTIARLPESQRRVLLLRYYGGLSCLEVAQKLGIPLGTVTKNLSRAYKNLRELLNKKIAEE